MEDSNTNPPEDVVMEPNEQEIEEPEDLFLVPIDILLLVKTTQNQNGLKQDDYFRYSRYCWRKVHRLRKATKYTQGRRKYVKNEIKLDELEKVKNNQRAVQIPLFLSERNWSQAMFLKKQLTEEGDEFIRNKHTSRKRLKKAYQYALELQNIIKEWGYDPQTCLESEAYTAFIKSSLDIEYSRFTEAMDALLKVNIIYKRLSKSKDSLEAVIYQEKVDQIAPLLRLCTYNIGKPTTNFDQLEEEYDKQHQLHDHITESMTGIRKVAEQEKIEHINYQGISIPLKTEKLRNSFQKLQAKLDALKNVEENKDNTDTTIKVKAHTDLLHVIEDCIVIIQKEKTQETKRNEASGAVYNLLLSYVKKIKQTSILERCLLKAFSFVEELQLSQVFEKQKIKGNCRPQVIMKLFDKALRALQTISQDKGSLDHVKIAELELREMIINTYLKFYVAVYFANENKSVSSDAFYSTYWILKRSKEDSERCTEYADRSEISKDSKVYEDLVALQKFAETDMEYMIWKTQAILMFEHQEKVDSMSKDFSKMDVKDAKPSQDDSLDIVQYLFDSKGNYRSVDNTDSDLNIELTDYNLDIINTGGKNILISDEAGTNNIKEILDKKVKFNKKTKLVELFPSFQPVPPKPFFFDLAVDAIEYPNIDQIIKDLQEKEEPSSGGLLGRIKTTFFG